MIHPPGPPSPKPSAQVEALEQSWRAHAWHLPQAREIGAATASGEARSRIPEGSTASGRRPVHRLRPKAAHRHLHDHRHVLARAAGAASTATFTATFSRSLSSVCEHPRASVYVRRIDVRGVDSKFIDARRAVISELLEIVLPVEFVEGSAGRLFEALSFAGTCARRARAVHCTGTPSTRTVTTERESQPRRAILGS
jgi:Uncharacterized protein conserved in bacteria N-term (DUF3322)